MQVKVKHIIKSIGTLGHGKKQWLLNICALLLVVVMGQLFYSSDHALPNTRLDGEVVSGMSKTDVEKKLLVEYSYGKMTTTVRGEKSQQDLGNTGVAPDADAIMKKLTDYPWVLRIIPFSLFFKGMAVNEKVTTRLDDERFSQFAAEIAVKCEVLPKSAGAVAKDGVIVLDPAKDGEACPVANLKSQILASDLTKEGISIDVRMTPTKPSRSDADVQALLAEANIVASRPLTISIADRAYAVPKETIATWLAFPEDAITKKLSVGLNAEAVQAYLATIQKTIYIAPGTTTITTFDGIETGRVTGESGRGINLENTTANIEQGLIKGEGGTVSASIAVLEPKLAYNRSYSKTPAGLQALVNDLAKDRDVAISVRKLGDSGVSANGDKQYHPASTYKLFVAYSVLKRIDSGAMSWGQSSTGGQTISQCFDNMIVNSDNTCAEWFGATMSWGTISNEARALGANNTVLSKPFVSTANDLALFLQKLESNQLGLNEGSRARLIDAMKRQVFRKGIPTGLGGIDVADKVGFLDAYLHDASIVYSPTGVYVLVIMTNSQNWGTIADIAHTINSQLQ